MKRQIPLLLALLVVVLGPILLRPKPPGVSGEGARTLVIITPHSETTRSEFGWAFEKYYAARTGKRVRVDWRSPGGTSEIGRYVASEYLASFQNHWQNRLGRPWSKVMESSFDSPRIVPAGRPEDDTPQQQARRAFLDSDVSCKIDIFFGGGAFDFDQQARAGRLIDCGFIREHPELFNEQAIPQMLGGEPFWDSKGRWVGTVLSSFGICYNPDALQRLGIEKAPTRWSDLADPRYRGGIALSNPTQSSSVTRAFEMLIQQQMREAAADDQNNASAATSEGWPRAMRLLMKIGANSRYFTDSSPKIALDVESGEAAAGLCIDFYGRFQSEAVRKPDGTSRLQYTNAEGGTSVSVDPVGMFRGAPNADVARDFIGFVMSPEGQKLWNWKVGVEGGPRRYALRRPPILKSLYAPEYASFRSDPDVAPYEAAKSFQYQPAWTASLFRPIAFIFRVMCVDPHEELKASWAALSAAHFPPEAMAIFEDVSAVDYAVASGRIRESLSGDKIQEVQLAKELSDHFRAQYRRAALAAEGK